MPFQFLYLFFLQDHGCPAQNVLTVNPHELNFEQSGQTLFFYDIRSTMYNNIKKTTDDQDDITRTIQKGSV